MLKINRRVKGSTKEVVLLNALMTIQEIKVSTREESKRIRSLKTKRTLIKVRKITAKDLNSAADNSINSTTRKVTIPGL